MAYFLNCNTENCSCHSNGIHKPYNEGSEYSPEERDYTNYSGDLEECTSWKGLLNLSQWEVGITENGVGYDYYHQVSDLSQVACRLRVTEGELIPQEPTSGGFIDFKTTNGYYCKSSCVIPDVGDVAFHWYFPGKTKWVILGKKRSYELLLQHNGTIPEWLEEAVRGYPTKGEGWNLLATC